ncbi:4'-phosphopantetheinyl transferase family protein [Desulfocicer vacuolatum]|uniref:4'-phosphopantetheinyl transferase family protein n=1 Tax=Desulfocicer vacuolatum TaxID=2298 RepID=UPI001E47ECDF|nr:4'-phosphopantetheinyl transferase superfamily protein [Desulfocicer vacuolatum]
MVMQVPLHIRELSPKKRLKALGMLARQSVRFSARRAGVVMGTFPKGDQGQPLPWGGVHWSLSHKPCHVAGVVSRRPVGIDIEEIKPVAPGLFRRICSKGETRLFHDVLREIVFFRCFTAKEAVLKLHGIGLIGLKDVSVVSVDGPLHLKLSYKGVVTRVEHFMSDGHVASIAGGQSHVVWTGP